MARILVIDDDPLVRETLTLLLRGRGHDVAGAGDGRQGLRLIAARSIDLVLTDVLMPEADGIEVVRAVSRDHPDVGLVAMSGGSSRLPGTDAVELTPHLGAHAILIKPFPEEDLFAAVEAALAAVRQPSSQG